MQETPTAVDNALDWASESVLRIVLTKVIPLITASTALNVALVWLQNKIGIDLPPAAVATWLGAAVAGAMAKGVAYVHNHGKGAAVINRGLIELEQTVQAGRQALDAIQAEQGAAGR